MSSSSACLSSLSRCRTSASVHARVPCPVSKGYLMRWPAARTLYQASHFLSGSFFASIIGTITYMICNENGDCDVNGPGVSTPAYEIDLAALVVQSVWRPYAANSQPDKIAHCHNRELLIAPAHFSCTMLSLARCRWLAACLDHVSHMYANKNSSTNPGLLLGSDGISTVGQAQGRPSIRGRSMMDQDLFLPRDSAQHIALLATVMIQVSSKLDMSELAATKGGRMW